MITFFAHWPIYARLCSKPCLPIYYEVDTVNLIPILRMNQGSEMISGFSRLT